MALERLRTTLTKGNLWLYVLALLTASPARPGDIKEGVKSRYGFSPATITFYSVLYRLRREGLVKKSSEDFRAKYEITERGRTELAKGREFMEKILRQTKA